MRHYTSNIILKIKKYIESTTIPRNDYTEEMLMKADFAFFLFYNKSIDQLYLLSLCCDGLEALCICDKKYCPEIYPVWFKYWRPDGFQDYGVKDEKELIDKKLKYHYSLDKQYFSTKKGIKLGMGINEIVSRYGINYSKEIVSESPKIIRYKWQIYGKAEIEVLKERVGNNANNVQLCENVDLGADYYIDMLRENGKEKAVVIYISQHGL